jgi:hypothetical protein
MPQANRAWGQQITPRHGITPAPPRPDPAADDPHSQITWLSPEYGIARFWAISILATTAPQLGTGQSLWYGMASIACPRDTAQEVYWQGYRLHLDSPDLDNGGNEAVTGANSIAWGTANGTGAALCVGLNLPSTPGGWVGHHAPYPGLETSGSGLRNPQQQGLEDRRWFPFPLGSLKGTTGATQRLTLVQGTAPLSIRLGQRSTIDVAFVVRSDKNSSFGANKAFACYIYGELDFGRTTSRRGFVQ